MGGLWLSRYFPTPKNLRPNVAKKLKGWGAAGGSKGFSKAPGHVGETRGFSWGRPGGGFFPGGFSGGAPSLCSRGWPEKTGRFILRGKGVFRTLGGGFLEVVFPPGIIRGGREGGAFGGFFFPGIFFVGGGAEVYLLIGPKFWIFSIQYPIKAFRAPVFLFRFNPFFWGRPGAIFFLCGWGGFFGDQKPGRVFLPKTEGGPHFVFCSKIFSILSEFLGKFFFPQAHMSSEGLPRHSYKFIKTDFPGNRGFPKAQQNQKKTRQKIKI